MHKELYKGSECFDNTNLLENQYKETLPIMNVESLVFSVLFQTLHNESRDGKTLMLLCSSLISVAKSQVLKIQFLYFNIPKLKLEQQSS